MGTIALSSCVQSAGVVLSCAFPSDTAVKKNCASPRSAVAVRVLPLRGSPDMLTSISRSICLVNSGGR